LQGQYFDEETGLHYTRFRYYEPQIGAFVSQDPLGLAAGVNLYQYAANTCSWTDPLGLSCYKYKFDDSAGRFRDAKTGRFASTKTVGQSLATKPNEAFFWSGRTNGIGGDLNAKKIAESRGGVTLEKLLEDRGIKMPAWDEANPISTKAWKDISGSYASQVSGKVRGVIGEQLRPDAVWTKDELPKLLTNSNVTEITTIDPATLVEKTIFSR
jgi:RHS repeat-associated protein